MEYLKTLINFFKNCIVYRKELSYSYPYDFSGLLYLMKKNIYEMEKYQKGVKTFVSVNNQKNCKRMRVVVNSLDRLIEDEYSIKGIYFENEEGGLKIKNKRGLPTASGIRKHNKSIRKNDLKIVADFINKHVINCWH